MDEFFDIIITHFEKLNKAMESMHMGLIFGAVINIIIIVILFKMVEIFLSNVKTRILAKDDKSQIVQFLPILERIFKFLIVFFVFASFLQTQGYSVTSLITGFGITGLAVGFAANSTISSVFGTFSIFSDKAYRIGDYIKLNDIEGTVEDVTLRSTKIRSLDDFLYIVPNSSVANGNICNLSAAKKRRIDATFGLVYSTTNEKLERAIKIVEEVLYASDDIYNDYVVFVDTLSTSSIDIRCFAYAKTSAYNSLKKIKSRFILEVIKRFRAEGLEFAFPSTSVYIEKSGE